MNSNRIFTFYKSIAILLCLCLKYVQNTKENSLYTYLNQLIMWLAWPPCLQDWHQVNQEENSTIFCSPSELTDTGSPDDVPICIRQMAHLGNGFLQLGHADIYKIRIYKNKFHKFLYIVHFEPKQLFSNIFIEHFIQSNHKIIAHKDQLNCIVY